MLGEFTKAPSFIGVSYFGHGYPYVRAPKFPNQHRCEQGYFEQATSKHRPKLTHNLFWISEDSYYLAVRYAI